MTDSAVEVFRKAVPHFRGKRVAFYGKSRLVALLLEQSDRLDVAAVVDSDAREKELFHGKTVISVEQAGRCGVNTIIVAARKSSALIVRKRILESCRKQGIELVDIYGNHLDNLGVDILAETLLDRTGKGSGELAVMNLFSPAYQKWTANRTARQFGYTFAAPVITDFCIQLYRHVREKGYRRVWLLSRDGYLPLQCLKILQNHFGGNEELIYLLTSREALGSDSHQDSYRKYLEKQRGTNRPLVVDFAAVGTCQKRIEELLDCTLDGYYFIHIREDSETALNIQSFYSVWEYADKPLCIYMVYPILELLVSSTGPSLSHFNERGEAVYRQPTIPADIAEDIAQAQQGILEYFRRYIAGMQGLDILPTLSLCDQILQLGVSEDASEIRFLNYEYCDEYYGRNYHLPLLR